MKSVGSCLGSSVPLNPSILWDACYFVIILLQRLKILIEPNDGSSSTSIEINELKLTENGSSNVAYHQPETEENAC